MARVDCLLLAVHGPMVKPKWTLVAGTEGPATGWLNRAMRVFAASVTGTVSVQDCPETPEIVQKRLVVVGTPALEMVERKNARPAVGAPGAVSMNTERLEAVTGTAGVLIATSIPALGATATVSPERPMN